MVDEVEKRNPNASAWQPVDRDSFEKPWHGDETSDPQFFFNELVNSDIFNNGYYDIALGKDVVGFKKWEEGIEKRRLANKNKETWKDSKDVIGEDEESSHLASFLSTQSAHYLLREFADKKRMLVLGEETPPSVFLKYEEYQEELDRAVNVKPRVKPQDMDVYKWRESIRDSIAEHDRLRSISHYEAASAISEAVKISNSNDKIPSNFSRAMVLLLGVSQGIPLNFGVNGDIIACYNNRATGVVNTYANQKD